MKVLLAPPALQSDPSIWCALWLGLGGFSTSTDLPRQTVRGGGERTRASVDAGPRAADGTQPLRTPRTRKAGTFRSQILGVARRLRRLSGAGILHPRDRAELRAGCHRDEHGAAWFRRSAARPRLGPAARYQLPCPPARRAEGIWRVTAAASSVTRRGSGWRRRPESNWGWRFCRPLPYHLATSPRLRTRFYDPDHVTGVQGRHGPAGRGRRGGERPHRGRLSRADRQHPGFGVGRSAARAGRPGA